MKNLATDLAQRPFVRHVATVFTGTAAAQAITIAFAPWLTRMYGPEVFGLQGVFLSIAGLLAVVAALGYPMAIVLPARDADAAVLARLSLAIGAATTALVTIVLAVCGDRLLLLLRAEALGEFLWVLPLAMVTSVLAAVLGQWLVRVRSYGLSARFGVVTALLVNTGKAGLGAFQPTAFVLIGTHVAATLVGTLLTGWAYRRTGPPLIDTAHATPWRELARRHADFALYRTPQNLINAFSQSLPVLLLAASFGSAAAGQYAITMAVLAVPVLLVGQSVQAVFYPRISQAIQRGEDGRTLIVRTTGAMAAVGVWPFVVVMVAGPALFAIAFGPDWRTGGIYAQWLAPWMFLQYLNAPAVAAIPALRLQRGLLVYELFSTGAKVLALWAGHAMFGDDVAAVALFGAAGVIAYVWLIAWVIRRSGPARRIAPVDQT